MRSVFSSQCTVQQHIVPCNTTTFRLVLKINTKALDYTLFILRLLHTNDANRCKCVVCVRVCVCCLLFVVVVTVVDDSHVQRIVLATEETTVTQQVSHRERGIKCQ